MKTKTDKKVRQKINKQEKDKPKIFQSFKAYLSNITPLQNITV